MSTAGRARPSGRGRPARAGHRHAGSAGAGRTARPPPRSRTPGCRPTPQTGSCSFLTASPSFLPCPAQEVVARVLTGRRFAEGLKGLPRGAVQVLRHLNRHRGQQVAVRPVLAPGSLAPHPEGAAARRPGGDPDAHRHPAERRDLDLRAERRLGEGDRHGHGDVVAGAAEDRVRLDVYPHVQVARRSAALTRCALAPEPDPLPVCHARGDAGLDRPAAHRAAAARTRRAGVVDDQAAAAALLARLGEREATQVPAGLAGALAGGTHPGYRPRLRPGAVARWARSLTGQPQRHRGAVDGVVERQRGLGLDVCPAARARLRASAPPAEHPAQQVAEPPAGAGGGGGAVGSRAAEQVAQVEREAARAALPRWPEPPAPEQRAGVVVLLAAFSVGQGVVRLGDLLEPFLRLGVALVGVGVVLAGELPVRLLDLVWVRGLGDAKSLVIVLLEEVLGAHWYLQASVFVRTVFLWPGVVLAGQAGLVRLVRLGGGSRVVLGLGDDHPGGPDDPLADLVAGLQDLDAGRLGHPSGLEERDRLVHVRVERLALAGEGFQAELGHDRLQRLGDLLEPADQFPVLPGPADVVEHREQRGQHVGERLLADHQPVPIDPLAVVGVLRAYSLQVSGALGELGGKLPPALRGATRLRSRAGTRRGGARAGACCPGRARRPLRADGFL